MDWKYLDTGKQSAAVNMALDAQLLQELQQQQIPCLHIYEWSSPAITYGYFLQPSQWLNVDAAQSQGIELARRPTGGGITLHLTDFAYSVFVPVVHPQFSTCTLKNYAWIHQVTAQAIEKCLGYKAGLFLQPSTTCLLPICSTSLSQYDLVINGKKVGGAAQRRTRFGFLHQGTIHLLKYPEGVLDTVIHEYSTFQSANEQMSGSLLEESISESTLVELKECFASALFEELYQA